MLSILVSYVGCGRENFYFFPLMITVCKKWTQRSRYTHLGGGGRGGGFLYGLKRLVSYFIVYPFFLINIVTKSATDSDNGLKKIGMIYEPLHGHNFNKP